ncbi:sulfite exporter TauE/SafE family protein [Alteromonas sp. CI.11.F.A3]|uniref:sulfite exporter TauE/SafE family protein n=1 Tax=Alteromonas sp. CI.11.F.A3 TaxID=3079555 RepID=UPI0029428932|nr:sulfite exporter TauE/SafE family protein [Alteromonas sp. CI.11.F.A3]WOI38993.1 sulfite exporter TauE/SafE family protein [Alteromonas sp. CI.11.F.A3]
MGFIAGLLGVGGGGILVPILTSMLVYQGIPEHQVLHVALGTSMACIIVTSFSSARAHHKLKAVNWPIVWVMGAGCIIGTFAATFFAAQTSAIYLALFFAVFMFYTAHKILFKGSQISVTKKDTKTTAGILSICIGGISALVSIGGGSLLVPYLNRQGMKLSEAVGTSAAIGLPIAVAGSAGYLLNGAGQTTGVANTYGYIYLPAVGVISLASVVTAPIGAKISHKLPVKILKKLFALLLVVLGVKMAWAVM